MSELLPCPFCGGEASKRLFYRGKYRVHCNVCDAHSGDVCDTEAEAIAAWNSRAERTCEVISHKTFCGAGGCEEAGELWTLSCGHEVMNDSDFPPNFCDECGCKVVGE